MTGLGVGGQKRKGKTSFSMYSTADDEGDAKHLPELSIKAVQQVKARQYRH